MLESKTKLIGNHRYQVTQLPSSQARKLLIRLVQMGGPVVASLLEDAKLMETTGPIVDRVSKVDAKTLAKMLRDFSDRIKEADLDYLCTILGGCTQVEIEGKLQPLDLETQELHFAGGNLSKLFTWLGFALEVQYADFFTGYGGEKPSPNPQEKGTQE